MFYSIVGKNLQAGLVTRGAVVVQATENFQWACGQRIDEVVRWAAQRGMVCSSSAIAPPGVPLFDGGRG